MNLKPVALISASLAFAGCASPYTPPSELLRMPPASAAPLESPQAALEHMQRTLEAKDWPAYFRAFAHEGEILESMVEGLVAFVVLQNVALEAVDLPTAEREFEVILRECGVSAERISRLEGIIEPQDVELACLEIDYPEVCAKALMQLVMEQGAKLVSVDDRLSLPSDLMVFHAGDFRLVSVEDLPPLDHAVFESQRFRPGTSGEPLARVQRKVALIASLEHEVEVYLEFWRSPTGWQAVRSSDAREKLFK